MTSPLFKNLLVSLTFSPFFRMMSVVVCCRHVCVLLLKKKILLHCFLPIFQFVLEECDDVDDFVKIRISSCLKASISPTAVDEQETLKNLGLGYTMMVCNSGY